MRTRLLAVAALISLSSAAAAHDLYLVSGIEGAQDKICARVGEEFPASSNAVTKPRVEMFRVNGQPLEGEVEGTQFCAPHSLPRPGVAEMVVRPTYIKLEAKDFNEYTKGEGFKRVIAAREQGGKAQAPGRELYSRYSKLLLGGGADATRALGHALEIVPEKDPATLQSGEALSVRVLFRGQPLADVQVAAVYAGAKMQGHEFPVVTRTDKDGRAVLKLDRPGLWYARLIHMVAAENDPDFEWRSFFATLTFTVPGK